MKTTTFVEKSITYNNENYSSHSQLPEHIHWSICSCSNALLSPYCFLNDNSYYLSLIRMTVIPVRTTENSDSLCVFTAAFWLVTESLMGFSNVDWFQPLSQKRCLRWETAFVWWTDGSTGLSAVILLTVTKLVTDTHSYKTFYMFFVYSFLFTAFVYTK